MGKRCGRLLTPAFAVLLASVPIPAPWAAGGEELGAAKSGREGSRALREGGRTGRGAREPGKLVGLVGSIVAVVPGSRTLVVDVPLAGKVLRVGAFGTEDTTIVANGSRASLEGLEAGARVRLTTRRVPHGTEAVSVEVFLGGP